MSTTNLRKRKRSHSSIIRSQAQQEPLSHPPPVSVPFEDKEGEAESEGEQDQKDVQDMFRRAFERRFAPLAQGSVRHRGESTNRIKKAVGQTQAKSADNDVDKEEEEGVWNGLDDSDDSEEALEVPEAAVEVVDYSSQGNRNTDLEGFNMAGSSEAKKFMSSKPPTFSSTQPTNTTNSKQSKTAGTYDDEDDDNTTDTKSAALDKANDLALHRLISESHLLSTSSTFSHQTPSTTTSSTTTTTTKPQKTTRHHQTDLRLRSLGAKQSLSRLTTGKIPLAHATGIARKKVEKEQRRRREAMEAGVVLEREVRGSKGKGGEKNAGPGGKRRERGVGGASVGKFRGGGTLVLRKGDVKGILGGGGGAGGGNGKNSGGRKMKRR